jgi:two-component system response regulator
MSPPTKSKLRVLMIDDDSQDIFFAKLALEKAGYPEPMGELRDGAAAVDFFRTIEELPADWPDVVIMDLKMPRMDGEEVLRWLRAHPLFKDLPVVILTSSDEVSDVKKTARLGILKFLTKEVHGDNLVATLDRFLAVGRAA